MRISSWRYMQPFNALIKQVVRPFSYLAIKHEHKWIMDWVLPGVLAIATALFIFVFRHTLNIYGDSGVISRILGFIQNLPGFYIAALAAIATFGRTDIDNMIPTPTPTIIEVRAGERSEIPLTRRRFLCMMFAFLTAECVVIILASIASLSFASDYVGRASEGLKLLSGGVFVVYIFFFYQMLLATFWGLFYLGDKIHQVD